MMNMPMYCHQQLMLTFHRILDIQRPQRLRILTCLHTLCSHGQLISALGSSGK